MSQESRIDLLQGTLDLMVLQTLDSMGPLDGYGLARRIEQASGQAVRSSDLERANSAHLSEGD